VRQEITVKRALPVNLDPKDLPLFQMALEVSFERLHPMQLKNVWILQDTVFAPGEFKFYSSHTHVENLGPLQFAKRAINCAPKSWRKIPKGIWVLDEWSANYFHWMTDCLPRIWEGLERDPKAPVLLPYSYQSLAFVSESLKLIGAAVIFFKSNQNLKVSTVILTARTASFPNFNLKLTQKTREKLSFKASTEPWRNVYISRKLAGKRKVHNETEVELILKKRGFEVVYAEQLNLSQEIQLMGETKILVSLHGAGLTNMLFLAPNTKVLELRNLDDSASQCYFNLAAALGLSYYYTLNKGDSSDTIMTDFTVDVDALTTAIDRVEKDC
jgi:capsular polysaccharide biosynthesis protein